MVADGPGARWERFTRSFFGLGNEVPWFSPDPDVQAFVRANEAGLEADPFGPFIVPHRDRVGRTTYFAISTDVDQAHELETVLRAVVGPTYTTYDGRPTHPDGDYDQAVEAAIDLAGARERVFTFEVVGPAKTAQRYVRGQIVLLLSLLHVRPTRQVELIRPIGRLLRDFDRALDLRDLPTAEALLLGPIAETGRLSGLNRLFLRVRLLAAGERWEELEALPSLNDLLRAPRPALVSDALAQLAMRMLEAGDVTDGGTPIERFERTAGARFGALVPSVDRIRSSAGARYYVQWQRSTGTPAATVGERLTGLSWAEDPEVIALLAPSAPADREPPPPTFDVPQATTAEAIADHLVHGQFDAALAALASAPPDVGLLPALLRAISVTFSAEGMQTLQRYRVRLGEEVVAEAIERLRREEPSSESTSIEQVAELAATWPDRLGEVSAGSITTDRFLAALEEGGLIDLVRSSDQLDALTEVVRDAASGEHARDVVDATLGVLQLLEDASPEGSLENLRSLRFGLLDLWCLGDDSGDLTRAGGVIDVLDRYLAGGCSESELEECIELLSARWGPFLTDRAFGLSLRTIEVLVSAQASGMHAVNVFASGVLGRVTAANADRLDPVDLAVADALSSELELGLTPSSLRSKAVDQATDLTEWTGIVGLYSLDENATRRASAVLGTLVPGAEVRTLHDKVSSAPLRSLASSAGVMVVAAGVAKHAATDAIRAARGPLPLTYAAGNGSSSLVRASLEGIATNEP